MSALAYERLEFETCVRQAREGDAASQAKFWAEYAPLMEIVARRNLRRGGALPPRVAPSPGFVRRLLLRTIGNLIRPRPGGDPV